jgi:hypothetical protein
VHDFFVHYQKFLLIEPYLEIEKIERDLGIIMDLSYIDLGPLAVAFRELLDEDLHAIDEDAMLTTLKTRTLEKMWRILGKIKAFLTEKTCQFFKTIELTCRLYNRFQLPKDEFYEPIYVEILPAILGLMPVEHLKAFVADATLAVFRYS